MKQVVLLAIVLGALLLAAAAVSLWVWDQLGDTEEGSLATQGAIEEAVLSLLGASPATPAEA